MELGIWVVITRPDEGGMKRRLGDSMTEKGGVVDKMEDGTEPFDGGGCRGCNLPVVYVADFFKTASAASVKRKINEQSA